jgi:hypothetical protein
MRAGGRENRKNCVERGPMQALFEGTVLRLPCVNRDWAGTSCRSPMPVIDGRPEKGGL